MAEDSMRITYEDPEAVAEKRRLMSLLGGTTDERNSVGRGGSEKGKDVARRSSTRIAGF